MSHDRGGSIRPVKRQPTSKEQQTLGDWPNFLKKRSSISPGEYQSDTVLVERQAIEPHVELPTVGWIHVDKSMPRSQETVVEHSVLTGRTRPGLLN